MNDFEPGQVWYYEATSAANDGHVYMVLDRGCGNVSFLVLVSTSNADAVGRTFHFNPEFTTWRKMWRLIS